MPKYIVHYTSTEYYNKEYDAASEQEAQEMFDNDDTIWNGKPKWFESEVNNIDKAES